MARLPLALVSTIDPLLRDAVALTAALEPGTVVVRHDLLDDGGDGRIRRVVSDLSGTVEQVEVPLDHACVSCAIREDAIPTLKRLAAEGRWTQAVLALPVAAESLPVARTLAPQTEPDGELPEYRLASVVCAVDLDVFADDVLGDDLLRERALGLGDDDPRGVGEALAGLVEHADVVVTSGDGGERPADSVLLDHLRAVDGIRLDGIHLLDGEVLFARGHDPEVGEVRTDVDREPTVVGASPEGIVTIRLVSDRPFHPDRLLHRIEELGSRAVRSRGVFWVPTRPNSVVGWEGCGGQLSVGELGEWSEEVPRTDLTFTGRATDLAQLDAVFEDVLLTEAESAEGLAPWLGRRDVLEPWLGERSRG